MLCARLPLYGCAVLFLAVAVNSIFHYSPHYIGILATLVFISMPCLGSAAMALGCAALLKEWKDCSSPAAERNRELRDKARSAIRLGALEVAAVLGYWAMFMEPKPTSIYAQVLLTIPLIVSLYYLIILIVRAISRLLQG
jgi:hypothetical protein